VANGFANRFLFACARRSKLLPDGGRLHRDELEALADILRGPVTAARELDQPLERTAAARELWHRAYPNLSDGRPGLLGAVTARAEAQVLRLSLLYALADGRREIGLEHLTAGLAVWDYCERSAAHIFGDTLGDNLADRIHAALVTAGDAGLTRSAIRELVGGRVPADRIEAALGLLERRGLATLARFPTGGRPVEKWRSVADPRLPYVPDVHSTPDLLTAPSEELVEAWHRVRGELERAVGEATWHGWLAELELEGTRGEELVLTGSARVVPYATERFGRLLEAAARSELGPNVAVTISERARAAA
jgi:hypothetical protein